MGQRLESNKTLLFYPTYTNIYGMADNTIGDTLQYAVGARLVGTSTLSLVNLEKWDFSSSLVVMCTMYLRGRNIFLKCSNT